MINGISPARIAIQPTFKENKEQKETLSSLRRDGAIKGAVIGGGLATIGVIGVTAALEAKGKRFDTVKKMISSAGFWLTGVMGIAAGAGVGDFIAEYRLKKPSN